LFTETEIKPYMKFLLLVKKDWISTEKAANPVTGKLLS
jgi:hypothetical protein